MEYAQAVLDPIYEDHANKFEAVQSCAARFTLGRYLQRSSVGDMLTSLDWPHLTQCRHDIRLAMFYKIHYGLVASPMPLILKGHKEPTRTENTQAYHVPFAGQNYYRDSFYLRTARVLNGLPESTVRAETLNVFKSSLPPFPSKSPQVHGIHMPRESHPCLAEPGAKLKPFFYFYPFLICT